MDANGGPALLGKKVFFLFPPSVIREDVVARLLEQEFEVYMIKDAVSARRLLRKFPDSIVFVNIDEGMAEPEWEKWILELMEAPETAGVGIGILSYNADEALQKKYLMEVGVGCGFVRLKLGAEQSFKILVGTLDANEAKGRRKYVRASCANDPLASVNIRHERGESVGTIRDISVVGFSCSFEKDPGFHKNILLQDIQLKLRGNLVRVEALVFGMREDGGTVYVMIFTKKMDGVARSKIRRYLQAALQAEIELAAKT